LKFVRYIVSCVTMHENGDETRSKVGRIIVEHGLEGFGDELEQRWTTDEEVRTSLRDLASLFNERVLEATLERQDQQPVAGTVSETYRLLTDDDADPSARTRVERELERGGVDLEALREDFVSHQAIHTYLTTYRDAAPPSSDTDPVETAESAISRLESRLAAVTVNQIDRLVRASKISNTDVEVFITVEVFCNDCGTSQSISEYLRSGGCDCSTRT
jgi:predicted component of type VI protein secretion system